MKTSLFDYYLPKSKIANYPATPGDYSMLMIIDKDNRTIRHDRFYNIINYLENSILVLNNSKVIPAKVFAKKVTGGKIELLFLRNIFESTWEVMFKGKIKLNSKLFVGNLKAKVLSVNENIINLEFENGIKVLNYLKKYGSVPIPPYIGQKQSRNDLINSYQTIYAKVDGSIAAPTAGFHFTKRIFNNLKSKNIECEFLTLHVGMGTFLPVKTQKMNEHKMHSEYFEVSSKVINRLNSAKASGKNIIAVGTTSCRVLESISDKNGILQRKKQGKTKLFIYPPYKFKFVDGLITNFHLPRSTLLALVCAFVSYPNTEHKFADFGSSIIGKSYKEAINNNYRFYSFGDAMLIF